MLYSLDSSIENFLENFHKDLKIFKNFQKLLVKFKKN